MLDWVLNIPLLSFSLVIPTGIYLFEVNNRNTGTRCEMYSKLTIKVVLVSLFILNVFHTLFWSTVNFKHVNAGRDTNDSSHVRNQSEYWELIFSAKTWKQLQKNQPPQFSIKKTILHSLYQNFSLDAKFAPCFSQNFN